MGQSRIEMPSMRVSRIERGRIRANVRSEQERRELAETLGKAPGKPLSEIIIEEHGGR